MSLVFYAINFESIVLLSSVGISLLIVIFPVSVMIMKLVLQADNFDFKMMFGFQIGLYMITLNMFLFIDNWR